jgi:hypothetical protein
MESSHSNMGAAGLFFLRMLCLGESSPSEFMEIQLDAETADAQCNRFVSLRQKKCTKQRHGAIKATETTRFFYTKQ